MQPERLAELRLPVMFNYEQGVVSDLVLDGQEKPWSANIKKGILNLLQVNLAKRNQIKVGFSLSSLFCSSGNFSRESRGKYTNLYIH